MSDAKTTIAELRELVNEFVERRDWHQFHSPKNLAMSMAIEAAELMEHFQWISMQQSRAVADDPRQLEAVADELADVTCYLLAMANELDLDISTAVRRKMEKNRQKYPSAEYRGRFGSGDTGSR
jgi:NTP pyrophosphatase (non-canonical NTP hydrolase)